MHGGLELAELPTNGQLVSDLERAGFYLSPGGKGAHRKFGHAKIAGSVILSGKDGDDPKHY